MSSRYEAVVDEHGTNHPYPYALEMIGADRRVLELGAAGGHMTRALTERGCRVTAVEYDPDAVDDLRGIAAEAIVGDLNDPATLAAVDGPFDAVLAGDVLEHLLDPERVLRQATALLAPGGRVVISLPNVAHADVRMMLLDGAFTYTDWGLLDRTHIRFFTYASMLDLLAQAGLVIVDLRRVVVPAFGTELGRSRREVPVAVVDRIRTDPEAETYQFVVAAVPDTGDPDLAARGSAEVRRQTEAHVAQWRHLLSLHHAVGNLREKRFRRYPASLKAIVVDYPYPWRR